LDQLNAWWAVHMPHWTELHVWRVNAEDYGLPQRRNRVILVAFDLQFANLVGGVPDVPKACSPVALESFLMDQGVKGPFDMAPLSKKQKDNFMGYLTGFNASSASQAVLAVVDLSRNPMVKKVFNNKVHEGYCPTLITANKSLHLIVKQAGSHSKVHFTQDGFRKLRLEERSLLSGVEWSSIQHLQTPNQAMMSLGNVIPVNPAGAVLQVIMDKWCIFEDSMVQVEHPLHLVEDAEQPLSKKRKRLWKTGVLCLQLCAFVCFQAALGCDRWHVSRRQIGSFGPEIDVTRHQ
jgi:hypothetical protein